MRLHNIIGLGINVAQIWPTSQGKKLCSFQLWAENIIFVVIMLCRLFSIVYLSQTHICIYGLVCTNCWNKNLCHCEWKPLLQIKRILKFWYKYQSNDLFIVKQYQLKNSKALVMFMTNVFCRKYFYNLDSMEAINMFTSHKDFQAVISKYEKKYVVLFKFCKKPSKQT